MTSRKARNPSLPSTYEAATLQAILDSVVDGIITISSDGKIATFNDAAERIFGYRADEVIGKNVKVLMPQPYRDAHDGYLRNYLNTGEAHIIGIGREVQGQRKDGTVFPMELAVGAIGQDEGRMFVGIVRDITTRRKAEDDLRLNHEMLDSISAIQSRFILDGNTSAAFDKLLEVILHLTESEYGFIGERLTKEDGSPYLKTHAITNVAWNKETREFYEQNAPQGLEFYNLKTLFGAVLTTEQALMTNKPSVHPKRGGLPEGHPPLNAFLGLPFKIGERMVGMIGIANRPGGYDQSVIDFLGPLTTTCGNIIGGLESLRQKVEAEEALRQAIQQLNTNIAEVRRRNEEAALLSELDEMLQSCYTRDEAYHVVSHMVQRLLPEFAGALYVRGDDGVNLVLIKSWGKRGFSAVFPASDCIAMRRGLAHLSAGDASPLNCLHVDTTARTSFCIPLVAQSETFGVLEIDQAGEDCIEHDYAGYQKLAVAVGRRVAISLANLKLGESLREQSVRDPLTGVFNRRYMEEVLTRELSRAKRTGDSLSLILIDIDYFKKINDTYGHDAGDEVLVSLAQVLLKETRQSDVPCRMGGEEFLMVMPSCSLENARARADQLCTAWRNRGNVGEGSQRQVTFSVGVATYPLHGENRNVLLRAVDLALYQAKEEGRDRIVVFEGNSA